ncbi:hypothetical protein [Cupriavidus gilardii]|uniref:hypothetical protein n=1 Tax=Cupriavidus gilardii TaxID=82541 RepID=UPI001EE6014C|nr:hypothetical protein [Cupriavidus gilardii]MCG5261093.1 hypothetical protein [Cupriavidus gilardii]
MNKALIAASVALAFAACGGDEDDLPHPHPITFPAEGLYRGKTSANQDITAFVLDDGTYYIAYQALPYSSGVLQGTMHAAHGRFTSSNGKDYSETFREIFDVSVDGTYATRGHLNGTVRYPATGQTVTFTSSYDKDDERTPTLATLAGSYEGNAITLHVLESMAIRIVANGAISGTGASGCKFTGVASPRRRGNLYDITVVYGPSPCATPARRLSGIAYYHAQDRTLFVTGMNGDRSEGVVFRGMRQSR